MMAARSINLESPSGSVAGPRAQPRTYKQFWLLVGVAVGGLLVSVALFWTLWSQAKQVAEFQFKLEAEKKVEALKQALANQLSVMSMVRAFYAGSETVERDEFKTFTDSILAEHPDIETLAWMPRVLSDQRPVHEEALKKDDFPKYQITQRLEGNYFRAAERKEYFPILFIEPWEKHQSIIGFDLGSLPDCLAAMDRAKDRLGPAITNIGIPGIDGESESTVYMFEYAHNEPSPAPGASNPPRPTEGFILGTFHLHNVIDKALEFLQPSGVDIYIFDVTVPDKTKLVLARSSRIRAAPLPILQAPPPESYIPIHFAARMNVADRTWLAYCVPADVYFNGISSWEPLAALFASLLITGIVVGYMFLLTGRTARIEKLVTQRTRELLASEQRFRLLVDNAADAFFLHDDEGRLLDVNQSACDHLGYNREELLKMKVLDIEVGFKLEEHHEVTWKEPSGNYPKNINGVHRRKDGTTFPVEVRLTCMEIDGRRWLLGLARDVTERKQAEEAIRKEQRFLRHLIDLQERERKLMAYEIHDGLAQQLTGALFKLQGLETAREQHDFSAYRTILDDSLHLIRDSVDEARRLIGGLRPPILDESGIVAAIEYLCGDRRLCGGPQIEFTHMIQFHRLSPPLEVALFRIAQECLTNACRYSQSPKIRVELSQLDHRVRLTVQDWGVGFDAHGTKSERFGLRGIGERARLLGGAAEINSTPGQGTIITVELPLAEGDIEDDGIGG